MERCAPQPYRKSVSHRILNRLAMVDSVPGTDLRIPDVELQEGLFEPLELERYRRVLTRMATPYKVDSRGRRRCDAAAGDAGLGYWRAGLDRPRSRETGRRA